VNLTASADKHIESTAVVSIQDDDTPLLTFSADTNRITEAGGSLLVTLHRNTSLNSLQRVDLSTDLAGLTVPSTVILPPDQATVNFLVRARNDSLALGDQMGSIVATANGFPSSQFTVTIEDDETPELTVTAEQPEITEGGQLTITVSRNSASTNPLTVSLQAEGDSRLSIPQFVTIPAGSSEAAFQVEVGDDDLALGNGSATLSASATSHAADSLSLTINDDDTAMLTLVAPAESQEDSVSFEVQLKRNTSTDNEIVVALSTDRADSIDLPSTVSIAAGESETSFTVLVMNDVLHLSDRFVTITASAEGLATATAQTKIIEDDLWSWTNPINHLDVNDDNAVAPNDALRLINYLNAGKPSRLPPLTSAPEAYYDVNSDGFVSPSDVLRIINHLNSDLNGEGEGVMTSYLDIQKRRERAESDIEAIDQTFALFGIDRSAFS
jgi:hypothetical protein